MSETRDEDRQRLVIVTGMSGAGKSSALTAFEDIGFQTVDNLPLTMVEDLLETVAGEGSALAVGVDSRTLHFSPDRFGEVITSLKKRPQISLQVLMMDAVDTVLVQRYSETRRKHPLLEGQPLRNAIRQERDLMSAIRPYVDALVDTSDRTSAETRRVINARYGMDAGSGLVVSVMSFGFAHGVPRDADLVFDVRFLRNPHYDPTLKPKTGQDEAVANFVRADEGYHPFVEKLQSLLAHILPRYVSEGKSYLTLAFGCTGGKHRSVMMAEGFKEILQTAGLKVNLYHRDMPGAAQTSDVSGVAGLTEPRL